MQNNQTQKSPTSGNNSQDKSTEMQAKALQTGLLINELRKLQGWNELSPKEALPMIKTWLTQFERHKVQITELKTMLNRAVDVNVELVKQGKRPLELNLTTLLAMRSETAMKTARKSLRELAEEKQISSLSR